MGISVYKIKKWYKMLTRQSISHVNQDRGLYFVKGEVKGYFNNLTEKVTKEPQLLESDSLPMYVTEKNNEVFFPVAIFQYGLGAYDLYLGTQDQRYFDKFKQCVTWALSNQQTNGAWDNFSFMYEEAPYGAMCQGEGASLLVRAYLALHDEKYLIAAQKALDFMLLPLEDGGTTVYSDDELILKEYTHLPPVLNGWIFALFGLYDMMLVDDHEKYTVAYEKTVATLKKHMAEFDNGYWSKYDNEKKIASPFYHKLHIAQLEALYLVTEDAIFEEYRARFSRYSGKRYYRMKAFFKKALQKILE